VSTVKVKRINFDKATPQGNWGVDVTAVKVANPLRNNDYLVQLIGLSAKQAGREVFSIPIEYLDEVIQALSVVQEEVSRA
jgi:hypothetical protein